MWVWSQYGRKIISEYPSLKSFFPNQSLLHSLEGSSLSTISILKMLPHSLILWRILNGAGCLAFFLSTVSCLESRLYAWKQVLPFNYFNLRGLTLIFRSWRSTPLVYNFPHAIGQLIPYSIFACLPLFILHFLQQIFWDRIFRHYSCLEILPYAMFTFSQVSRHFVFELLP